MSLSDLRIIYTFHFKQQTSKNIAQLWKDGLDFFMPSHAEWAADPCLFLVSVDSGSLIIHCRGEHSEQSVSEVSVPQNCLWCMCGSEGRTQSLNLLQVTEGIEPAFAMHFQVPWLFKTLNKREGPTAGTGFVMPNLIFMLWECLLNKSKHLWRIRKSMCVVLVIQLFYVQKLMS